METCDLFEEICCVCLSSKSKVRSKHEYIDPTLHIEVLKLGFQKGLFMHFQVAAKG